MRSYYVSRIFTFALHANKERANCIKVYYVTVGKEGGSRTKKIINLFSRGFGVIALFPSIVPKRTVTDFSHADKLT